MTDSAPQHVSAAARPMQAWLVAMAQDTVTDCASSVEIDLVLSSARFDANDADCRSSMVSITALIDRPVHPTILFQHPSSYLRVDNRIVRISIKSEPKKESSQINKTQGCVTQRNKKKAKKTKTTTRENGADPQTPTAKTSKKTVVANGDEAEQDIYVKEEDGDVIV